MKIDRSVINYIKAVYRSLQNKKLRRSLYIGLVILGLAFLSIAIYRNWSQLTAYDWEIEIGFILLSLAVYPAGMLPTVAAWHQLLKSMQVQRTFMTNLRLYSLSALPRHVPGFVWFVSSRSLLYQEQNVPASITISATGLETVLLALTGFITSLLTIIFGGQAIDEPNLLGGMAAGAILLVLLLFLALPFLNKELSKRFSGSQTGNQAIFNRSNFIISIIWMFAAWIGGGLILFSLVRAVQPVDWSYFPIMVGVWGAAGAVSLTLGIGIQGLGIREVTIGALLSLFIPPISAVVIAIVFRLVLMLGELVWVGFFLVITSAHDRLFHKE